MPHAIETLDEPRQNGIVVRLFADRGYGFIRGNGGEEFFVHMSNCIGDTRRELEEGTTVTFQPATGQKGARAMFVKLR